MLGAGLTHRQQLVAANDRGYIPAMLEAGASESEIACIRSLDRAAQGISAEDERLAAEDIGQRAEWRGDRVMVRCLFAVPRRAGIACTAGRGKSS